MTTHKEYFALLQHPHYYQNISNLPYEPTIASSDQKDSESSEEERAKEDDPFEEDEYGYAEVYYDMFGNHKKKDTREGQNF